MTKQPFCLKNMTNMSSHFEKRFELKSTTLNVTSFTHFVKKIINCISAVAS